MSNVKNFLKKNKKTLIAFLFILIGILLIIPKPSHEKTGEGETTLAEYQRELEERVASMCASVEGVGRCKVFITFERGESESYKGNTLIESKPPKVLGVTVVCKGADSFYVKSSLTNMLTALFDIGTNRIAILKLN